MRSNLAADLLVFIVFTGNPLETPLELVRNEESIPVKEFDFDQKLAPSWRLDKVAIL